MLRLSIPSSNSLTMLANAAKRNQAACTSEVSSNAHIWNPQAAQRSVSSTSPGACVRCYAANRVIVCRESVCISLGPYVWGNKRNSLLVLPSFPRWMFSSGHCFLMNSIVENLFFQSAFNHLLSCLHLFISMPLPCFNPWPPASVGIAPTASRFWKAGFLPNVRLLQKHRHENSKT